MGRKWPFLQIDRSVGSWPRLAMGFVASLLALALILAGLNSLLGSATGFSLPGLASGIGSGEQGDTNKYGSHRPADSLGGQGVQGKLGSSTRLSGVSLNTDQGRFDLPGEPPALPVMRISGQTGTAYLRVGVPQTYPNTELRAPSEPYQGEIIRHRISASGQAIRSVSIEPISGSSQLAAPLYATQLLPSFIGGLTYCPETQTFRANSTQTAPYEVSFELHSYAQALLQSAKVARRPSYTQLAPGITERTRQLARQITAGAQGPYDQAKRLEQYLKTHHTYDFEFEGPPAGHDPVDWFLFEEKVGICRHFNSAFVTMARSLGLPARLVIGYAINPSPAEQITA